jgi:hypothetical protein
MPRRGSGDDPVNTNESRNRHRAEIGSVARTALLAVVLCGCAQPRTDYEDYADAPDPGDELIVLMTEGELDRLVDNMVDRLIASPQVRRADRPLRVAPPEWTNATDVPVGRPAEFVDRFTALINGRTGSTVQFIRRPWVLEEVAQSVDSVRTPPDGADDAEEMAGDSTKAAMGDDGAAGGDAEAAEASDSPNDGMISVGSAPADFASRLTLLPAGESDTAESLGLRLELFEHSATQSLVTADESFLVLPELVREVREVEQVRETVLAEARSARRTYRDPHGELRFGDDDLPKYIAMSARRAGLIDGERLELAFRVGARRPTRLLAQVSFYDDAGRRVEVTRPYVRVLRPGDRSTFVIRSQLPATAYLLFLDRMD